MQRERIEDMEVGDYLVMPRQEWHMNHDGQALFAQAQAIMAAHQGDGPAPQYQIQYKSPVSGPPVDSILERLR